MDDLVLPQYWAFSLYEKFVIILFSLIQKYLYWHQFSNNLTPNFLYCHKKQFLQQVYSKFLLLHSWLRQYHISGHTWIETSPLSVITRVPAGKHPPCSTVERISQHHRFPYLGQVDTANHPHTIKMTECHCIIKHLFITTHPLLFFYLCFSTVPSFAYLDSKDHNPIMAGRALNQQHSLSQTAFLGQLIKELRILIAINASCSESREEFFSIFLIRGFQFQR